MAKKATAADDDQVDDELDVEDENGGDDEGEGEGTVSAKPKPTPKAKPGAKSEASSSKAGKAKASADEDDDPSDPSPPPGFTAKEYEEFLSLKEKVAGIDLDKLKTLLPEAEREKAQLNARRRAAEKRAKDAEAEKAALEEETRAKVEELELKWANAEKRAADKELASVVDDYCRGLGFVGATQDLQRAAGSNFADIARRALKSEYDEDGEIVVTGAKDGKPAKEVLKALVEKHAYLIARKAKPGPLATGGHVPPGGGDDSENATEAALAALRARRNRS